jgi:Flp pilus assembly protein TadD
VIFAVVLFGKSSSAFFATAPRREMGSKRAYALATFCLGLGLAAGYSFWEGAGAEKTAQTQNPSISGSEVNQPPPPALPRETFENTVRPLLEALDKDPNDYTTIVKLANLYDDERKYPEAKQCYEQAQKIHPEDPDVRTDLGTVYYRRGDFDRAIAEYLTALQYQPGYVNTLYNLGIVKWKGKKDPSGAVAAWEELLQRNPNLPERQQIEQLIAMVRSGKQ